LGANLNAKSKSKQTALHFVAATKGDASCAEALIKSGANRSLKNVSGETALDIAKENAKPEIVRLLEDPATYPAVVVAQASARDDDARSKKNACCCTVS